MIPVDTTIGLQSGGEVHTGQQDLVVGYLVTLQDGYECRMGPDLTRAQNYAVQQHARSIEAMFVRRAVREYPR